MNDHSIPTKRPSSYCRFFQVVYKKLHIPSYSQHTAHTEMSQRVLSIQSHVVHGYVGNKAAVFPLQLLGLDVDVINSVHFSNHTGYSVIRGDVLQGEQLLALLNGLEQNDLLQDVGHVLTGYIGSDSFCQAVVTVVEHIRKANPKCRYVCDPVLGDSGKFYVPKSLVEVYKIHVIPHANVVTPNQFEAEQLTGMAIHTINDAKQACLLLHQMGPSLVILTSLVLQQDGLLTLLASSSSSSILANRTTDQIVWRIDAPLLPGHYTGTGDLIAALILGHTANPPYEMKHVLEKVISTMQAVIQRTMEANTTTNTVASTELKLIQSKQDIENPIISFTAYKI